MASNPKYAVHYAYVAANREKVNADARDWYQRNKEKRQKRARELRNEQHDVYLARERGYKTNRSEEQRLHDNQVVRDWRAVPANWVRGRVKGIKSNAVREGVPFSEDIIIELQAMLPQEACKCCGCTLDWEHTGKSFAKDSRPSIDRVIPMIGYVPGNVHIICMRCNIMKRDLTIGDVLRLKEYFDKYLPIFGARVNAAGSSN